MCIVCNMPIDKTHLADDFLESFEAARHTMQRATKLMLECSRHDRRYDSTHKQMVGLCKQWNKLEQTREHGTKDETKTL